MSTDHSRHTETIREQFRIQSSRFEQSIGGQGNRAIGPWIIDTLGLIGSETVLDVATGTGLLARDLSPYVSHVTGIDVTPEMIAQARQIAAASGFANLTFDEGDATSLPYADDSFDLVISRIAIHHFDDPEVELGEMRRVCKPNGRVTIVDITVSDDLAIADTHNRLERLRDPSHTTAFCLTDLTALAQRSGLRVVTTSENKTVRDLDEWMDVTATDGDVRATIHHAFEEEIAGGALTGMLAHREDGRLKFVHHWAVLVCELSLN